MSRAKKYLVDKHAVCSECLPAREFAGPGSIDAWAKAHAEETGHIVSIEELHDVSAMSCSSCDGITPKGELLHSPGCPNESEGKQS